MVNIDIKKLIKIYSEYSTVEEGKSIRTDIEDMIKGQIQLLKIKIQYLR